MDREAALALAREKLRAKKRENRQKSAYVGTLCAVAILLPAALLAGLDLGGLLYPPPAPPPPLYAMAGDHVTVEVVGFDDNGTQFWPPGMREGTLGNGNFVVGLEKGLLGLREGDPFNITVLPKDAWGNWSRNRTTTVQKVSERSRNYTMEVGNFDDRWPGPTMGQVVPTKPWNSTVVAIGTKYVTLRYEAEVGQRVHLYKYWNSAVTAVDNESIFLQNDLWLGYNYTRYSSTWRTNLTYVVTSESATSFFLDGNPPLAGRTLHFQGRLVAIRPGTGAGRTTGTAVSIGGQACERCHAADGFVALDAAATARLAGGMVEVNVTVDDPWLHELEAVTVDADAVSSGQVAARASQSLGTVPPSGSSNALLGVPARPGNSSVVVTVNGTAHHQHKGTGKPNDNSYQLSFTVDVGGAGRVPVAESSPRMSGWNLVGQVLGAAALGVMAYPIGMGLKRHAQLKPKLHWPRWPWVTTHFTLSLIVVCIAAVHAVVLMSTKYRGLWTPEIVAGVIALAGIGTLGFSGIVMAKWTDLKWKPVRKFHFYVMLVVFGGIVVHVLVAGTTVRGWLGL